MESKHNLDQTPNFSDVRAEIEAIRAQIAAMGANDSEFSLLNQIILELDEASIAPQEAILRARGIRDSKQAYH